MRATKVRPKNWETRIARRWNIRSVKLPCATGDSLFVTRCSRCKSGLLRGTPHELYTGTIPQFFFRAMAYLKLPYAVLSDKHGLHIDTEILDSYDIHPATLTDAQKRSLGKMVRAKTLSLGKTKIVFYNNSPIRSDPYFQILYYSGLDIAFCTRLSVRLKSAKGEFTNER